MNDTFLFGCVVLHAWRLVWPLPLGLVFCFAFAEAEASPVSAVAAGVVGVGVVGVGMLSFGSLIVGREVYSQSQLSIHNTPGMHDNDILRMR